MLHKLIDYYGMQAMEKADIYWLIYSPMHATTYIAWIDGQAQLHFINYLTLLEEDFRSIICSADSNVSLEEVTEALSTFTISTNIISQIKPSVKNKVILSVFKIKKANSIPSNISEEKVELFYSQRVEQYCFPLSQNKEIINFCFLRYPYVYYYHNDNPSSFHSQAKGTEYSYYFHNPYRFLDKSITYHSVLTPVPLIPKRPCAYTDSMTALDWNLTLNHLLRNKTSQCKAFVQNELITILFPTNNKRELLNKISLINAQLKEKWNWSSQKPHVSYPDFEDFKTHRLLSVTTDETHVIAKLPFNYLNIRYLLDAFEQHLKLIHHDYTLI